MAHLSPAVQQRLIARALSPDETLAAIVHLRTCQSCRDSLATLRSQTASWLMNQVLPDSSLEVHLSADLLAAYLDGDLHPRSRASLESHISSCPHCQGNLADLRQFRNELLQTPSQNYTPVNSDAIVQPKPATAGAIWGHGFSSGGRSEPMRQLPGAWTGVARWLTQPTVLGGLVTAGGLLIVISFASLHSFFLFSSGITPTSASGGVTVLDGDRRIHLDLNGIVNPPATLSKDDLANLNHVAAAAVRNDPLSLPPVTTNDLAALKRAPSVLLGQQPASVPFQVLHPVRTLVQTVRPSFEWTTAAGATSYTVHIVADDRTQEEVVTSSEIAPPPPNVTTCVWELPQSMSLVPGKRYRWYVTAVIDNQEVDAPGIEEPQAKFAVLSEMEVARLDRLKKKNPHDPLLDGLINLSAGLLDDAQTDFQGLLDDPKQTSLAKEFLSRMIARIRQLEKI